MSVADTGYRKVLQDDESLAVFMRNMAKFDRYFCELMATGVDFNIRLEVHGDEGKLRHCRVLSDGFDRPIDKNGKKLPRQVKTSIVRNREIS